MTHSMKLRFPTLNQ
ncbi:MULTISPECIES: erythromycin resistance leader peptide [Planococcus]